ncbi:MAG: bifunctional adenosylcobinamide kinase/adenosylcobinamide-phosphate guanylyltransferase [Alicyclobacillus macrosporangiidus]|uniref:bifunctional adenosylcobinamide kinase/adenosylcobinamide-phosphate guanylyltransferase n=1 Tax=Alicyclobacillus macrosporangiidus TaxID=392015 RepID=UPI0026E9660F|nr:bifunctional adenosylcobinamide kinase/adenosylcobinamide-phosphate guanylyltransferase [Alicyclobacillus macrosporangiidus]MCL6599130.1 bifunctional adenosylcobinamide kinase/adenosylcobinamide-phosphate guanylyltransferase [Alicyclobacillus macrosporangiidus]
MTEHLPYYAGTQKSQTEVLLFQERCAQESGRAEGQTGGGCTFVLGGARSGKSTFAERWASRLSEIHGLPVTYVATAQVSDSEMEDRILRHRMRRPDGWLTVEEPLDVATWIAKQTEPKVIIVDCLTLLLNNWMWLDQCSESQFFARMEELVTAITQSTSHIVVVSNEAGQGLVPGDPLSRQYRDWLGLLNQAIAKQAEFVVWVVAGIPIDLKKFQVQLP